MSFPTADSALAWAADLARQLSAGDTAAAEITNHQSPGPGVRRRRRYAPSTRHLDTGRRRNPFEQGFDLRLVPEKLMQPFEFARPRARSMPAEWVHPIRDPCVANGTPFFFKQWGGVRKHAPAGSLTVGRGMSSRRTKRCRFRRWHNAAN